MTADEITVHFESGDLELDATIRREVDDIAFKRPEVLFDRYHDAEGGGPVEWVQLTEANVRSAAAFTRLLRANARGGSTLNLWCYRDVWLGLLALLDVNDPLPHRIEWPPTERADG